MTPPSAADIEQRQFDAWNPGICSRIPDDLRHLCTMFRPDCVFTSLATASEISDLFGVAPGGAHGEPVSRGGLTVAPAAVMPRT